MNDELIKLRAELGRYQKLHDAVGDMLDAIYGADRSEPLPIDLLPKDRQELVHRVLEISGAINNQEPIPPKLVGSPDDTASLDFVGIGFKAGVEMTLEIVNECLPTIHDLHVDIDKLRNVWAEREGGLGEIVSLNKWRDGELVVTHGWAYRLIAFNFLSHMEAISAENFVRQPMHWEIMPSPKHSNLEDLVIEVWRMRSFKTAERQRKADAEELERLRQRVSTLEAAILDYENETAVLPEDVSFLEYIRTLKGQIAQHDEDWLTMLNHVALLSDAMKLDDSDWRLADDDTLLEQFDPWHVLSETASRTAEWNGVDLELGNE